MKYKTNLLVATLTVACAGSALAEVSADEAKKLGTTLTVWGAEVAGNKEGTIPAYDAANAQPKPPSNWDPKNPGPRKDPWGEKPLFTITAQNAARYADKLDAMVELFKKYPNFRMDVYPTHRTYSVPKFVADLTIKNATSCKAAEGGLVLEGCYGGLPFPMPTNGSQLMWNHLLSYENVNLGSANRSFTVPITGSPVFTGENHSVSYLPFYDPAVPGPRPSDLVYWKYHNWDVAPARIVGQHLVLMDSLKQIAGGRRAWQYIPGQRRVKLAPDLAYDTPSPYSGGSQNMDDAKGFLGAIDHFNWTLKGKKEKFIIANNFLLTDPGVCPESKVFQPHFPNPDCIRWELHRVWVVQGDLKPEFRHVYHRRVHYWDEDGYGGGSGEMYDAGGSLYRINNTHQFPFYRGETEGTVSGLNYVMDLRTGIYSAQGMGVCDICGWWPMKAAEVDKNFFSPEAMAGQGIR